MAWQTELTLIVRHIINDLGDTPTYDDSRLQELILVAAQFLIQELDFSKSYTVDVDQLKLTPDPTDDPKDNPFINLTCYKAACILAHNEYRLAAKQAIRIKDGSSSIDFGGVLLGSRDFARDICQIYNEMKFDYESGQSPAGRAVFGPYRFTNSKARLDVR